MVHAIPVVEQRQRPEAQDTEVITVNRTTDDLGNEVVNGGQTDGREPQSEHIVREPPVDGRLNHAPHRLDEEHHLRGSVEPREPKNRGQKVPLGNVQMALGPQAEGDNRPDRNERITNEKNRSRIARHLQPLDGRGITDQDSAHAHCDANIVEQVGHGDQTGSHQRNAAQAAHQPNGHTHRNLRGEPVNDRVEVSRADIGKSEPFPARQETRGVQLDTRHQCQNGAGQKPRQPTEEKEEHRHPTRGVDLRQCSLVADIGASITR